MDLTDSYLRVFPADIIKRYDIREVRNAAAVLENTSPDEFEQLVAILQDFELNRDDILAAEATRGPSRSA